MQNLTTIGRAEKIDIVDFGLQSVPAKVDTGADSSSIWVSQVSERPDGLQCVLFGPESPYYTGEIIWIAKSYSVTRIANSFGHKEVRYKVQLRIRVRDKLIKATFTLADRSTKTYPILLGRRMLHGKFLVDVSQGKPLYEAEKRKRGLLQHDLQILNDNEDNL
jgi:hypothetical protein